MTKLSKEKELENSFLVKDMGKILSSLANEDALRIFQEANEGITSSTEAIKKLGLTQKRYYTWLNRLIDVGVVEKRENVYVQTMLGKFCFKLGTALLNAVAQRDQLELADKLMKSDALSVKEKEEVLRAISKKDLVGTAGLSDIMHEVKMITDYDTFIDEVIEMLDGAKETAYVVAGKTDLRVKDAVMNAIDRGTNLHLLSTETGFSENREILAAILNPASIKALRTVIKSKEINFRMTKSLSYSFVVIDGEFGLIELPHPAFHGFYVAFEFRNASFCKKLIEAFTVLYKKGKEDPRIKFVKKYLGFYK